MTAQTASITTAPSKTAGPIAASERIPEIDILRGFALLGILLVNIAAYGNSFFDYVMLKPVEESFADQAAAFLVAFFGEGKFYALFSFLFGFGLAIQMSRAAARGVKFVPLYLRRMLALLAIGLVHAYLIWVGDILAAYAVLGLILLLFRKSRPRTLVIWSVVLLALIILINLGLLGLTQAARITPEGAEMIEQGTRETLAQYEAAIQQNLRVYSSGTIPEIIAERASDLSFIYPVTLFITPNIFAMFLLGLAAGKKGIFHNIPDHLPLFRKLQIWGLVIGIGGNLLFALAGRFANPATPTLLSFLASTGKTIGAPMLSAFYLSSIILLAQNPRWRERLMVLAPVGRMALSNYLFQSLVCTMIFYSYGLGLYGQVGEMLSMVLAVAIFAVQVPISHWWMRRYQFGPVEWLWRALTYGKAPAMRRQTAQAAL